MNPKITSEYCNGIEEEFVGKYFAKMNEKEKISIVESLVLLQSEDRIVEEYDINNDPKSLLAFIK